MLRNFLKLDVARCKFHFRSSMFHVSGFMDFINKIMKIERFEDLEIWQLARELCKLIFAITSQDPFNHDFKLRDQIRGSSGSVMDNIAEGFERDGNKEFAQFLSMAKGSSGECRSQSYRAFDYQYVNQEVLNDLINRTTTLSKKISSMITYLKRSDYKGYKFKP